MIEGKIPPRLSLTRIRKGFAGQLATSHFVQRKGVCKYLARFVYFDAADCTESDPKSWKSDAAVASAQARCVERSKRTPLDLCCTSLKQPSDLCSAIIQLTNDLIAQCFVKS